MKRIVLSFCVIALLLLGACGTGADPTGAVSGSDAPGAAMTLRVIDGEGTNSFVLAGENSGDLYTAAAKELTVYLDGKPASPADLKNGMTLTVDAGYTVLETWPAQFTGTTVRALSDGGKNDHGDLSGLYLQVLEDLWTQDAGLNGGAEYISVDLHDAPGNLSAGEASAIAWIFAGRHNAQPLQLSFEELKANGYVPENTLYWENGVLMHISKTKNGADSAQKIKFDAEKWRSGDGAIFFMDCTAERGKGVQWEPYKPGHFAVS